MPNLSKDEASRVNRVVRKRARFLVDHNIGALAEVLRKVGWNAVSAEDIGIASHSDEDIFAAAWRESRIIITSDRDFLDDRRFPLHRCPGVVVVPNPSEGMDEFGDAIVTTVSVIGKYGRAFNTEKILIYADGSWLVRGFSKARGRNWEITFKRDELGEVWTLE